MYIFDLLGLLLVPYTTQFFQGSIQNIGQKTYGAPQFDLCMQCDSAETYYDVVILRSIKL